MDDLVSAVITTHNRKKLVEKAIQSVLSQTYNNIECIVVDDASDEDLFDLQEEYENVHYYRISKEESCGGNHARNVGIKKANGKYIAFLDDDDEWLPSKIEKQMQIINNNPEVGLVYCGRIYEWNMDQSTRQGEKIYLSKYKEGDLSKEILIHIIACTSTILTKKELLEEMGGFDEKLNYWQEYELCIRLMQVAKVKLLRENLVLYRVLNSDKKRLSNNSLGWEDAVRYIYNKHERLYSNLNYLELGSRKYYYCIDGINRTSNKMHKLKYIIYMLEPNVVIHVIRKIFMYESKED